MTYAEMPYERHLISVSGCSKRHIVSRPLRHPEICHMTSNSIPNRGIFSYDLHPRVREMLTISCRLEHAFSQNVSKPLDPVRKCRTLAPTASLGYQIFVNAFTTPSFTKLQTQIAEFELFSEAAVACRAHTSDGAAIPSL
jgi:hypothetical protein